MSGRLDPGRCSGRHGGPTVREAQARFFATNGMPADGGYAASWWRCRFGRFGLSFYNFDWRRKAIAHHDLHHILTGYSCTLAGEIEMAAWEFAAGRYPHIGATLFCLPLVFIGALIRPRRTFAAFLRGRRSTTLYRRPIDDALLDSRLGPLRTACLPETRSEASRADRVSYCVVVLHAAAVTIVGPLVAAWMIGMAIH